MGFRQDFNRISTIFLLLFTISVVVVQNIGTSFQNVMVRLNNGRQINPNEGRVEVSLNMGRTWGTICSTQWSFREGNVICRQLNKGYAAMVNQTTQYGSSGKYPWALLGTLCRGNEKKLSDCFRESVYPRACNAGNKNVAVVRCIPKGADLSLGLREIQSSLRLDTVPMTRLTCAMEENCLSRDAYVIRRTQPNAARLLLRFATKAENVGTADFSPYANYDQWQWHQCHRHYHSMETFASFDIYNFKYQKMAQGHKASFCLMDTNCKAGIRPQYICGNRTQGISMGCSDVYTPELDCQWIDVTTLPKNKYYILRVALNPEYKVGELSFENNGAECILYYTGLQNTTRITNCVHAPLWFRM